MNEDKIKAKHYRLDYNELGLSTLCVEKDKEIERLNKDLKDACEVIERLKEQLNDEIDDELKQSEIMVKQHNKIERLHSIIKEVREWLIEKKETIERFEIYKRKETGAFWYTTLGEIEKYLEILDKAENK